MGFSDRVPHLEMDSISKKVKRNVEEIVLTATEYKILELLMSNRDKVFNRIQIAENIWGTHLTQGQT